MMTDSGGIATYIPNYFKAGPGPFSQQHGEEQSRPALSAACRHTWNARAIATSILQAQLVAQDIVAMLGFDGGLALPTLAAQFTCCGGKMRGNCVGQFLAQVKIAANAFVVGTSERKHRLGVGEIDRVFDFTRLVNPSGGVVREIHLQGFQLAKLLGEVGRGIDSQVFLLTIFRTRAYFVSLHSISR